MNPKPIVVRSISTLTDPILKWKEQAAGFVLGGKLLRFREGQYGLLSDIETAERIVTIPCPVALAGLLQRVRINAEVCIEYLGRQTNPKSNREYHGFKVTVDRAEDLLPEGIETELAALRPKAPPSGAKGQPKW